MDTEFQTVLAPAEKVMRVKPLWRTYEGGKLPRHFEAEMLSARTVELIAKAGMSSDLRAAIEDSVLRFLERQPAFAGSIVLTAHNEPRRILVMSFWRTERDSRENRWEFADEVQKKIGPLIDALSRVRTYKADIAQTVETCRTANAARAC